METPQNHIGEHQTSPAMLNLLRARKRVLDRVKLFQRIYLAVILALPAISLWSTLYFTTAKPWVSLFALAVGAFDAMFLDPWRKKRIKLSARIQEEFDCNVLEMQRNPFTAGKTLSAEEIHRESRGILSPKAEKQLRDWYPKNADRLPIHVARLVCQRTNLWYDSQLRNAHRTLLWILAAIYFLILIISVWHFTLAQFILVALIPFGPFFTWIIREHHRQGDAIALVDRLLAEITDSIHRFSQAKDSAEAMARSRELQDAIFGHRATSPLTGDLVYNTKRANLEEEMEVGAADFVRVFERSRGENPA